MRAPRFLASVLLSGCPTDRELCYTKLFSARSLLTCRLRPGLLGGRGGAGRDGAGAASGWLRGAGLLDDRFQRVDVIAEGAAAGRRQRVGGTRFAVDEVLLDADVAVLFQGAHVDAQVAVGHLEQV